MSNITRNYKVEMLAMFVAASLIGPVVALGDNIVFATKKHKNNWVRTNHRAKANGV